MLHNDFSSFFGPISDFGKQEDKILIEVASNVALASVPLHILSNEVWMPRF